ncbi:MAG: hypothetical protein K2I00_02090 [Ruminococcus sp.]|nr:hypothetical protein [Ruminococcus sp.]
MNLFIQADKFQIVRPHYKFVVEIFGNFNKFGGIANIDSTYTATYVDTRTSNFWKGDEVVTSAYSVTNDFYKYYGLSKSDVYPAMSEKSKNITLIIDGVTYTGTLIEK